jgi:hypothetical protein
VWKELSPKFALRVFSEVRRESHNIYLGFIGDSSAIHCSVLQFSQEEEGHQTALGKG